MKSYKIKKDPNVLAHPEGKISVKVFKNKCVREVRKIQGFGWTRVEQTG